jgi:uncharacterized protein YkwD
LPSPSTRVAGDFRRWAGYAEPLRRHRAITHLIVAAAALAVAVGVAIPTAPTIKAGYQPAPRQESILPANIGMGIPSDEAVTLTFPAPMDRAAVADALGLAPATDVILRWTVDSQSVALVPVPRWAIDERYVVHVPAGTATADGNALAADWRASFTTQTAPHVVRLRVEGVVEAATALPVARQEVMASVGTADSATSAVSDDLEADASAETRIGVTFSTAMSALETEAAFRISPEVPGTFAWEGTTLWFTPAARLQAGTRHTVTITGARDLDGNPLGGDASFSFTTRAHAQALTVSPSINAVGVADGAVVQVTFSQPMATAPTGSAFTLTDAATGRPVVGTISWSPDAMTLTFDPTAVLPAGRTFTATVGAAALDADGNPVTFSWGFRTAGGVTRAAGPVATATPAGGSDVGYALSQVNAARASYGRAPLVLDATISAVAYGHAADMAAYGYFSHTSLNGMTFAQRLTAGGVSYGYRGENICYLGGASVTAALNWCHAQFMAEPYPGGGNHKDNILSPNFRRIGIGIAIGSGRVYVVWDFTD